IVRPSGGRRSSGNSNLGEHMRSDCASRGVRAVRYGVVAAFAPALAWGACNIIPPAEQVYPSTLGSVASPVTLAGNTVEVRLGGCDGAGFDATPANNQIAIRFLPAGAGQPPAVIVDSSAIMVPPLECSGVGSPCNDLLFTMPPTPGLAGP